MKKYKTQLRLINVEIDVIDIITTGQRPSKMDKEEQAKFTAELMIVTIREPTNMMFAHST